MTTGKDFYEELTRAPELPPHLYNGIRRAVRRRTTYMRTMVSLAATVVLTMGITAMLLSTNRSNHALSAEVASELQSIRDFGNGNDISKDLEMYTFYDGEFSK